MSPLVAFFSSLRLTVFCLVLWMILIFIATLAQVDLGIYFAKKQYLDSWWVLWDSGRGFSVPTIPGGLLVGWVLLINLITAHFTRFKWTWKKLGLWLVHIGIMVLIVGGGISSMVSRENQLSLQEGETKHFIQSMDAWELALISDAGKGQDQVVSIPHTELAKKKDISIAALPFQIRVKEFWFNAQLGRGQGLATQGIGRQISAQWAPTNTHELAANTPTALLEVRSGGNFLGTWLASSGLGAPQFVWVNGKSYQLVLRPLRRYLPYSIGLLDFKHEVYLGTQIPKNFSSKVRVIDGAAHQNFTSLIFMNNPLRYRGLTFYQASFGNQDTLSVLQVVQNGVWWVPYVAVTMIFIGLLGHFGMMLVQRMGRK